MGDRQFVVLQSQGDLVYAAYGSEKFGRPFASEKAAERKRESLAARLPTFEWVVLPLRAASVIDEFLGVGK